MITVKNNRIRVTVTQAIWNSFTEPAQRLSHTQILPLGDIRFHAPEQIQRGLVLSEAMSKLGNASELKLLEKKEPDSDDVSNCAKFILMRNYLEQYGRYNFDESIMRYENGYRMSQGMKDDVMEAEAYAQGQLFPLSREEVRIELINYIRECIDKGVDPGRRELRFNEKLMNLRAGAWDGDAAKAITEATKLICFFLEFDLRYRKARAAMDGWQIEVIGEMPTLIGSCHYINNAA